MLSIMKQHPNKLIEFSSEPLMNPDLHKTTSQTVLSSTFNPSTPALAELTNYWRRKSTEFNQHKSPDLG